MTLKNDRAKTRSEGRSAAVMGNFKEFKLVAISRGFACLNWRFSWSLHVSDSKIGSWDRNQSAFSQAEVPGVDPTNTMDPDDSSDPFPDE